MTGHKPPLTRSLKTCATVAAWRMCLMKLTLKYRKKSETHGLASSGGSRAPMVPDDRPADEAEAAKDNWVYEDGL
jgi:hypothetical protein